MSFPSMVEGNITFLVNTQQEHEQQDSKGTLSFLITIGHNGDHLHA